MTNHEKTMKNLKDSSGAMQALAARFLVLGARWQAPGTWSQVPVDITDSVGIQKGFMVSS